MLHLVVEELSYKERRFKRNLGSYREFWLIEIALKYALYENNIFQPLKHCDKY